MAKVELKLINIDGFHIDTDKGEMTIEKVRFSFDASGKELDIDFLQAVKVALTAIEAGNVKLGSVN